MSKLKNKLLKILCRLAEYFLRDEAATEAPSEKPQEAPASAPEAKPATNTAEKPATVLEWAYGGVNGAKAQEDSRVQIENLSVAKSGMRYKWANGDLSAWGLSSGDAGALACIFYRKGNKWIGGKFDWISSSRLTRDFKNVECGYRGWNAAEFFAASEFCFCILESNAKRRSNIIYYSGKIK